MFHPANQAQANIDTRSRSNVSLRYQAA